MITIEEIKEELSDPTFRLVIRSTVIDGINKTKLCTPQQEIDQINLNLAGTGVLIKDTPGLLDGLHLMDLVLNDEDVINDLLSDLDIDPVKAYLSELIALVNEL